MKVLGFMTGTSLDAVDMAVLETDGEEILELGPAGSKPLEDETRALVKQATAEALQWPMGAPEPAIFAEVAAAMAREHIIAADDFMAQHDILPVDLTVVGLQGQTVLHEPPMPGRPVGRTVQLIDAQAVANALGVAVAYDFRTGDVAAGGQGAPLAPVYHEALVRYSNMHTPMAVLNLGGVGNVTLVDDDGRLEGEIPLATQGDHRQDHHERRVRDDAPPGRLGRPGGDDDGRCRDQHERRVHRVREQEEGQPGGEQRQLRRPVLGHLQAAVRGALVLTRSPVPPRAGAAPDSQTELRGP